MYQNEAIKCYCIIPSLNNAGAAVDQTLLGMSHKCLIGLGSTWVSGPKVSVLPHTTYPNTTVNQVHLLPLAAALPTGSDSQRHRVSCHIVKMLGNGPRDMTKNSSHRPGLQISKMPVRSGTHGMCLTNSDPRKPHATHRNQGIHGKPKYSLRRLCVHALMCQVWSMVDWTWLHTYLIWWGSEYLLGQTSALCYLLNFLSQSSAVFGMWKGCIGLLGQPLPLWSVITMRLTEFGYVTHVK